MRLLVVLAIFYSCQSVSNSSLIDVEWEKMLGGDGEHHDLKSVAMAKNGSIFIVGRYSPAKPSSDKASEGISIWKLNRLGDPVFEHRINRKEMSELINVAVQGNELFVLGRSHDGTPIILSATEGNSLVSRHWQELYFSGVSKVFRGPSGGFVIAGSKSRKAFVQGVTDIGKSLWVGEDLSHQKTDSVYSDGIFFGESLLLVRYTGKFEQFFDMPGSIDIFELGGSGKRNIFTVPGRSASLGKAGTKEFGLLYDSGESFRQGIRLVHFDDKYIENWNVGVIDSNLGFEPFSLSWYAGLWLVAGSLDNRVFVSGISRDGVTEWSFHDASPLPTINTKASCGREFCVVAGTSIQLGEEDTQVKSIRVILLSK